MASVRDEAAKAVAIEKNAASQALRAAREEADRAKALVKQVRLTNILKFVGEAGDVFDFIEFQTRGQNMAFYVPRRMLGITDFRVGVKDDIACCRASVNSVEKVLLGKMAHIIGSDFSRPCAIDIHRLNVLPSSKCHQ